ncbi:hypothetical protein N9993_00235 [bacterium]|jgi:hypothetical protein|nr:hypothetical protein [bacterium]|tara:strand:- start:147 stop:341 length:195 start_codon:yes stop_codon:yes gene_type:complete
MKLKECVLQKNANSVLVKVKDNRAVFNHFDAFEFEKQHDYHDLDRAQEYFASLVEEGYKEPFNL